MIPATQRTCDEYRRMIAAGEEVTDVIGWLASEAGVLRPAIWKRLRNGGVIEPYKTGGKRAYYRRSTVTERENQRAELPRVDRDPCQRCGVRHDIGCNHSRAPLGMVL